MVLWSGSAAIVLIPNINVVKSKRLENHTKFNTEITKSFWNEKTSKWELTAKTNGKETVVEFNWLISCIGGLHKPMIPEFKGRDLFKGSV